MASVNKLWSVKLRLFDSLTSDILMWHSIFVAKLCYLNRDFMLNQVSLNRDSLNRDFTLSWTFHLEDKEQQQQQGELFDHDMTPQVKGKSPKRAFISEVIFGEDRARQN